ncbi:MAG: CHAT domain-containing protein [Cyanobacteria bacterium SBLK]|nr:CHAT domain-containing protein [Cyanobacteria bacterium SBLK]
MVRETLPLVGRNFFSPSAYISAGILLGASAYLWGYSPELSAFGQPIVTAPDGTGTIVTPNGDTADATLRERFDIHGGSLSADGANLFHSLEKFGLSTHQIANFLAHPELRNILTRIVGGEPSLVDGLIQVTGGTPNLFLMNPAGFIFGSNATLNLPASLTVTTATGISFERGWFNGFGENDYGILTGDPGQFAFDLARSGSIINAGELTVAAGHNLTLLAGTVVNTGTLQAESGNITVAAIPGTHKVRISQNDGVLSLVVEPPRDRQGEVLPFAPMDLPTLLTEGAKGLETGLTMSSGEVTIAETAIPTESGTAIVSGELETEGAIAGNADILGEIVGLIGAEIDVSGTHGGGSVRIGGGYKGEENIPNAIITAVDENSAIRADGRWDGDGGTIVVWSEETTRVYGEMSARGGEHAGDGGLVETSSRGYLEVMSSPDISASVGDGGTWLIDPHNLAITDNPIASQIPDTSPFLPSGDNAELGINFVLAALTGEASVIISTLGTAGAQNGDITINASALSSVTGENTLILNAAGGIAIEGTSISSLSDRLHLNFLANDDISLSGNASISSGGGNITFASSNGAIDTSGGTISSSSSLGHSGAIYLNAAGKITTGEMTSSATAGNGGNISLQSSSGGIDTRGGTLNSSSSTGESGEISLNGSGDIETGSILSGAIAGNSRGIRIQSTNGSVDTTLGSRIASQEIAEFLGDSVRVTPSEEIAALVAGSGTGNGGSIAIEASGDIVAGNLFSASTDGHRGGAITLTSTNGSIDTTTAQNLTATDRQGTSREFAGIDASSANGSGGTVAIEATGTIATGSINASAGNGRGGEITLKATENITAGSAISTAIAGGNGGNIRIESANGSIDATVGSSFSFQEIASFGDREVSSLDGATGIISVAIAGNGGNIELSASGNIVTGHLISTSIDGTRGGDISLRSTNGAIDTSTAQNITATVGGQLRDFAGIDSSGFNGGAISLEASTAITASSINSSGRVGNGGNVTLDPSGDIEVVSIDAQGGASGNGGNVDITAGRFFRATGTFIDQNQIEASISTAGGRQSGAIAIRHGGGAQETSFIVGDASINGTAGAITTGSNNTLFPLRSFADSFQQGNIQLITEAIAATEATDSSFTLTSEFELTPRPQLNPRSIDSVEFENKTLAEIQDILAKIAAETGVKPAIIYASFWPQSSHPKEWNDRLQNASPLEIRESDLMHAPQGIATGNALHQATRSPDTRLELVLVTAETKTPIRRAPANADYETVTQAARRFRRSLKDENTVGHRQYLQPSQQFYQWLIAPLDADLQAEEIENLVFILDERLRSLPLAVLSALHSGRDPDNPNSGAFAIEKYSVGLMPSVSLTDTRYRDLRALPVLAMGASEFPHWNSLPAVPIEIDAIDKIWISTMGGKILEEKDFTLANIETQRNEEPYGLVHMATHGIFNSENPRDSFIALSEGELTFSDFQNLKLNAPPIELLVLSACQTSLGNGSAELGIAGYAHRLGVKSVLGSVWEVNDLATLGLMTQFYHALSREKTIKAEALRQAQLAMSRGQVYIENGRLYGIGLENTELENGISLSPEFAEIEYLNLSHPHYWAGFTIVGNPW